MVVKHVHPDGRRRRTQTHPGGAKSAVAGADGGVRVAEGVDGVMQRDAPAQAVGEGARDVHRHEVRQHAAELIVGALTGEEDVRQPVQRRKSAITFG